MTISGLRRLAASRSSPQFTRAQENYEKRSNENANAARGRVFTAVDALLYPSFASAVYGTIAVMLVVPQLCVQLWDEDQAGDHRAALKIHARLLTIWNALTADNLPANIKTLMEI